VPFGGRDHDWAALEFGAWIAAGRGVSLRLLGTEAGLEDGGRDASGLLASASLVVQQVAGVVAEPVLIEPGSGGVLQAASGAGLLVIGLSDRWRHEGIGSTRSTIAREAPAPLVFVRRGSRPGVLAPRERVTGFGWSTTRYSPEMPKQQGPPRSAD
jgi:hypothetical protein